jgi:hypothetical protein
LQEVSYQVKDRTVEDRKIHFDRLISERCSQVAFSVMEKLL